MLLLTMLPENVAVDQRTGPADRGGPENVAPENVAVDQRTADRLKMLRWTSGPAVDQRTGPADRPPFFPYRISTNLAVFNHQSLRWSTQYLEKINNFGQIAHRSRFKCVF